MSLFLYQLIKSLALPPGIFILLLLLGLVTKRKLLSLFSVLMLYLLSTPFMAVQLTAPLEQTPALSEQQIRSSNAQAIVALTGGRYLNAPEYGRGSVGTATLERLRYAAHLHRETRLPVIISGGSPYPNETPGEAQLCRPILQHEFGVNHVMVEDDSPTTRENAHLSLKLLKQRGIRRILLVTHAWHMPRAVGAFSGNGIEIIPAPTKFYTSNLQLTPAYRQWLPGSKALHQSRIALHEYLGMVWYQLLQIIS